MTSIADTKNLFLQDANSWLEGAYRTDYEWIFADLQAPQDRITNTGVFLF